MALRRGECGTASSQWRELALASDEAGLAERATAVALACGQYAAAEGSAARWLQLEPAEDGPALARVRALLQSWRLDDAGKAFTAWLAKGGRRGVDAIGALSQDAGDEPTWAMLRTLNLPALKPADMQLALAELALRAGDASGALARAGAARTAGAGAAKVAATTARAQAVLGVADAAMAAAREAAAPGAKDGDRLALAEVLLLLDRDAEAEAELQRLRNEPTVGTQAGRELARLAFERGEYAIAEERAGTLLQDPQGQALAVYLLGVIAERRGDETEALAKYRLLDGSGLAPQAQRRAALLLYRDGERDAALAVLAAARDADPAQRIRSELAIGSFLADAGAPAEGLARLDSAAKRSPGHPDIDYQRAVLMERAGQVDAAVTLLEAIHRTRPADAAVTNALGFTMADHKRDLPRAEQLVREALAAQPDNAAILDSLGWVLYRRGQAAAALAPLQRAFRLLKDGEVGAHLAEVLSANGRKGEMRELLRRALAADPDNAALTAVATRLAPGLAAPKPSPSLEPARRTSI
jgi:tetratricopeptide (TPR) repeat protein